MYTLRIHKSQNKPAISQSLSPPKKNVEKDLKNLLNSRKTGLNGKYNK